jgi:hypothetical protein
MFDENDRGDCPPLLPALKRGAQTGLGALVTLSCLGALPSSSDEIMKSGMWAGFLAVSWAFFSYKEQEAATNPFCSLAKNTFKGAGLTACACIATYFTGEIAAGLSTSVALVIASMGLSVVKDG